MAIHIGWRHRRWRGLIVAGVCFIVPAALMVLALAWAYERLTDRPELAALLYGIKPVIIAIVLQALWRLGRQALKSAGLMVVLVLSVGLCGMGVNELVVLLGAGALVPLGRRVGSWTNGLRGRMNLAVAPLGTLAISILAWTSVAPIRFSLMRLFLFFLKVGSVLLGSGYVLLAFLRSDLVDRWGWLSESQLLDAIAVGQVTPGPVFTTATFTGYVLGGFSGAFLATVGIFLPAFLFVAMSGPLVPRIRRSASAGAFLDGVNAASLALMAVVTWRLAHAAIIDRFTLAVAIVSGIILIRFRLNSIWLILGSGTLGWIGKVIL
jgi:chromate transporter